MVLCNVYFVYVFSPPPVVGGIRAPPCRQFMYHGVGSFWTVCGKSGKTVLTKDIDVVLLRIGRVDWVRVNARITQMWSF